MDKSTAEAGSIAWILDGTLPAERLELTPLHGAALSVRRVTADDQARWRDKRRLRMMGFGALGDEGDSRERSYVLLPIPEWLLDCCTACVEVSRSADLPDGLLDDHLLEAGFAATGANQLDFGCTAVVDLLRLTMGSTNLQVPITELLLTSSIGHYRRKIKARQLPDLNRSRSPLSLVRF